MRVFQGVSGQAGQPKALADALKNIGVRAESYCSTYNKFSYSHDHQVDFAQFKDPKFFKEFFLNLYNSYDVFHFHASSFLMAPHVDYPSFQDLFLLRELGKKIVFHFRGSEARVESLCRANNPFHYYDIVDKDIALLRFNRPDWVQRKFIDTVRSVAHRIYVNDAEINSYVPEGIVVPRALDPQSLDRFKVPSKPSGSTPLLITHAPSKRAIKGTDEIIQVMNRLKKKGLPFEFQLVENKPHQEAMSLYSRSDIIIDQMRIGWYGVLSVEAMALGKPVVCYIRQDLKKELPSPLPLVASDLDTLESDLEKLILDNELRSETSKRAQQFFSDTHDAHKIAVFLKNDYEKLLDTGSNGSVVHPEEIIKKYSQKYQEFLRNDGGSTRALTKRISRLNNMRKQLPLNQFASILEGQIVDRAKGIQAYQKKNGLGKTLVRIAKKATGQK